MSLHKEINFEDEICAHLADNGWLLSAGDAADFDRKLALFPADVIAWMQETLPDAWNTLTKNHGDAAGPTLISRLRDSLDQNGTFHVLRHGFDTLGVKNTVRMA